MRPESRGPSRTTIINSRNHCHSRIILNAGDPRAKVSATGSIVTPGGSRKWTRTAASNASKNFGGANARERATTMRAIGSASLTRSTAAGPLAPPSEHVVGPYDCDHHAGLLAAAIASQTPLSIEDARIAGEAGERAQRQQHLAPAGAFDQMCSSRHSNRARFNQRCRRAGPQRPPYNICSSEFLATAPRCSSAF
jgi:hypothetical protein